MLTSQKVIDAINEQIGYEFSAELQYYAIAAHFATEALPQLRSIFSNKPKRKRDMRCGSSNMWSTPADAW